MITYRLLIYSKVYCNRQHIILLRRYLYQHGINNNKVVIQTLEFRRRVSDDDLLKVSAIYIHNVILRALRARLRGIIMYSSHNPTLNKLLQYT